MNPALLVLAAVIGIAGYKDATKFERRYGQGPWGASPAMWGVVCFLFGLIGALVLYIAERRTKKRLAAAPPGWSSFDKRFVPPPPPPPQWGVPPSQATPSQQGGWSAPPQPGAPPGGHVGGTDFIPHR